MTAITSLAALAAGACGDPGDDAFGMYELSSYVFSDSGCTGGMPVESPPSHLRFRESLYEQDGLHELLLDDCSSAEEYTCEVGRGVFALPTATGYRGTDAFAVGDELDCTLSFTETLVTVDGGTLEWLNRNYQSRGALSPCTDQEAFIQGATLSCTGYSRIVGRAAGE